MNLLEATLFRLASSETISLQEAKIIKALHEQRACTAFRLQIETGLEKEELLKALRSLQRQQTVSEKVGIYFIENFEEKILQLVQESEAEKITVRMG